MTARLARLAASLAVAGALTLPLSGCSLLAGQPAASKQANTTTANAAALTAYIAAVQAQVPALKKSIGDTYKKVTITADPPVTMVYTYTFARKVDRAKAKVALDKQVRSLQSVCDQKVFPEMKTAGISAPKARYTYLNPDGSKVWSHTLAETR